MWLALCSSCATRGNVELLEAQLRSQESVIHQYERRVSELENTLAASEKEIDLMRTALAGQSTPIAFQEDRQSLSRAKDLVFNTLLTGGQDQDSAPGDEAFQATLYPCDSHGEIVKLEGDLEIEAIDPSQTPGDRSLGRWRYSSAEARKLWHTGFLASGYQIREAWQKNPIGSKVVLIARLTTVDGRTFEATHTLPVTKPEDSTIAKASLKSDGKKGKIQKVSGEVDSETRRVPDPEPADWARELPLNSGLKKRPTPSKLQDSAASREKFSSVPAVDLTGEGLKTSDRWTDADAPVVR